MRHYRLVNAPGKRAVLVAAIGLAWTLLYFPGVATAQAESHATWGAEDKAAEKQVLKLVNQQRKRYGCQPLQADSRLRAAASRHSKDMARRNYFSHNTPEGTSFVTRSKAAGHPSPGGENIAKGQGSAKKVMSDWMDSRGHRENIVNCEFTTIGISVNKDGNGRRYWAQEFGR